MVLLDPTLADVLNARGELRRRGQLPKALADFGVAIKLNPDYAAARASYKALALEIERIGALIAVAGKPASIARPLGARQRRRSAPTPILPISIARSTRWLSGSLGEAKEFCAMPARCNASRTRLSPAQCRVRPAGLRSAQGHEGADTDQRVGASGFSWAVVLSLPVGVEGFRTSGLSPPATKPHARLLPRDAPFSQRADDAIIRFAACRERGACHYHPDLLWLLPNPPPSRRDLYAADWWRRPGAADPELHRADRQCRRRRSPIASTRRSPVRSPSMAAARPRRHWPKSTPSSRKDPSRARAFRARGEILRSAGKTEAAFQALNDAIPARA